MAGRSCFQMEADTGTERRSDGSTGPGLRRGLSFSNTYAAKKTVAQGMMDIALITANANQLRYLLRFNHSSSTFTVILSLIIFSLFLQVLVGVCLIFKGRCDLNGDSKYLQANQLNNFIVLAVFLVTVINVFIAAFTETPPTSTHIL
nr:PREDICTED: ninjurin-2-like isoform X1 [Bemisia tabaci]XP_018906190.1 PREDICTED: ninjurin-2-like isoform X2 [Bemisia tabaci]